VNIAAPAGNRKVRRGIDVELGTIMPVCAIADRRRNVHVEVRTDHRSAGAHSQKNAALGARRAADGSPIDDAHDRSREPRNSAGRSRIGLSTVIEPDQAPHWVSR
jgi:hypothetical protein